MKGVPGNISPTLICPFVLALEKGAMSIESNFLAKNRNVMRREDVLAEGDFNWEVSRSQRGFEGAFMRVGSLTFQLVGCHFVTEHI
jgi:hypothetical protein